MFQRLEVKRFGLSVGTTLSLGFIGCVLAMSVFPDTVLIRIANSLLHGLDVEPIIRWEIPVWETALGLVLTMVLGWLAGATCAFAYNLSLPRVENNEDDDASNG